MVEPLAVAWHAVSRSPLQNNDTVLVVGAGPIGLAIVQVLRARGITDIVVAEVSQQRRQFARTLGASVILDPEKVDVVGEVRSMTGDAGGAAIAFECSGAQLGLDAAVGGIRVRGTAVIVSLWEKKPLLDAFAMVHHEKYVTGSAIYDDGDFEAVIEAIASGKCVGSAEDLICFCSSVLY